jgi:hypothetical protein
MKKTMVLIFAATLGLLTMSAILTATPASADDKEKCAPFVEKIISGSPWHATIIFANISTFDLVFFHDNGQLKAKMENISSAVPSRNGLVMFLEVEFLKIGNCAVSFESMSGADYKLIFNDVGNLSGTYTDKAHRKAEVSASPSNSISPSMPDKK